EAAKIMRDMGLTVDDFVDKYAAGGSAVLAFNRAMIEHGAAMGMSNKEIAKAADGLEGFQEQVDGTIESFGNFEVEQGRAKTAQEGWTNAVEADRAAQASHAAVTGQATAATQAQAEADEEAKKAKDDARKALQDAQDAALDYIQTISGT